MANQSSGGHRVLADLLERARTAPPDAMALVVADAVAELGGRRAVLYLVDYEQQTLQPVDVGPLGEKQADVLQVTGSAAGDAYLHHHVVDAEALEGWTVWAPVMERSEALGVLEVVFDRPGPHLRHLCSDLGLVVGHLLAASGRFTDVFELARRRRPMNLPAEIQWDLLLPSLTFSSERVGIVGIVEPAYEIGGDCFDYSLNEGIVDLALFDSMGHGLEATLVSTLVLGAYRYARRRNQGLVEIAETIDAALSTHYEGEGFVTGDLCRLDSRTGHLRWVNAGHPLPLLVRGGNVEELPVAPCYPLGLGIRIEDVGDIYLEPGDRVVLYSDGVVEARPDGGEQLGVERLKALLARHLSAGLPPGEVLRRLTRAVKDHRAGDLRDDATMVLLHWTGPGSTTG